MPPISHLTNGLAFLVLGVFWLTLFMSNKVLPYTLSDIWFDDQRLAQLLCWSAAFFALAFTRLRAFNCWPLGLLSVAMLVRAAVAPLPGWAIAEASLFIGLFVTSWWVSIARRATPAQFDSTMIFALVWLGLANAVMPLLLYIRGLGAEITFHPSQIFYGFSNHRFFTQVQLLTIPLLALPAISQLRTPAFRYLTMLTATLCWALTFTAGTRAVYVAMLIGSGVAWCWLGAIGKAWVKTQARYALLGWALFVVLFHIIPWVLGISFQTDNARLTQIDSAFDSSGRLAMWREVLGLIMQHPLWGIGPMQYAALSNRVAGGPHNIPLQFLLEWGIPLGSAMIAIPLIGLWKLVKLAKSGGELAPLRTCLFITLLIAAIDSLFEGIITVPYSAVLLAVIIGWAWGTFPETRGTTATSESTLTKTGNRIFRATCLLLGVYLAWFAIYPLDRIKSHNLQYLEISKSTLMPRMWAQGLIRLEYDDRYPDRWFKKTKPLE